MSAIASTLRFTPSAAPAGLPTASALWCPACRGTFRDLDRHASCPKCQGSAQLASDPRPPEPGPVASVPALLVDGDPALAKLVERQRTLPAEIRDAEARLTELRAQQKALYGRTTELRVKASVGLAKDRDADRVHTELIDVENSIQGAEQDLDELVVTSRFIAEGIAALGETNVGARRIFANEDGGVAVGVLRFFARRHGGRRTPLDLVDRFRNLVARLG